jgi:ketosteroid isomerase-like protein
MSTNTLALVRRAFELFDAGDLEGLFDEVCDPSLDYSGDPEVAALAGWATDLRGTEAVLSVWRSFFEAFDEVRLSEIEFAETAPGQVVGSLRMVARGGSSQTPIDAPFHHAWVVRDGRAVFLAVKLDRSATEAALADHIAGER